MIMRETGLNVEKLSPRSPESAAVSQRTYWTGTGRSTPMRWRYAATVWESTLAPWRRAPSGPPGVACMTAKSTREIPSIMGIICRSLRPM